MIDVGVTLSHQTREEGGSSEMLMWFEKIVFYIRVALIRCGKRVGDVQSVFSGHLWLL